jgi:hypothetical protein
MTPAQEAASKVSVGRYVAIRTIADQLLNGRRADAPVLPPDEQSVLDTMALQCVVCREWHSTQVVAKLSKC